MNVFHTDGGCRGNGQKNLDLRRMVAVVADKEGRVLIDKEDIGGSNNIAELWAVKECLAWCSIRRLSNILIETDSQVAYWWTVNSEKKIKQKAQDKMNDLARVLELREAITELKPLVAPFQMKVISREQNLAGHFIEDKYGL